MLTTMGNSPYAALCNICFWLESTLISNLEKILSYTNHWAQEQSFRALTDAQRAAQPKVLPQYPWGPGLEDFKMN